MYFDQFPLIQYDSVGRGELKDVTNIFRRVAVRSKIKANTALYDTYNVKDGETPEMIAHRLYGNAQLHWVVLLFNDVIDRFHDWPMSSQQFESYLLDKYETYANIDAVHHYEITETSGHDERKIDIGTVNTDYPSATAISNRTYEEKLQDEKREIKLLDPRYIDDFVQEFKKLVKETVI
jgi:hypothetical protein